MLLVLVTGFKDHEKDLTPEEFKFINSPAGQLRRH
tara:strand:+ start:299 stop:403 length:105 start_codon:yes stop_codon:yes gene_type:complete